MFALYSHRYLHLSRFIMSLGGNNNELACVYAALILNDEGLEINSDNIAKILKASNIETEAYWPTLFAKLCKGKDITAMISSVGSGGGGGGGGGGSGLLDFSSLPFSSLATIEPWGVQCGGGAL